MTASTLRATWFDGKTSRPRPVVLVLQPSANGPALHLQALDGARERIDFSYREVGWPERWSGTRLPPNVAVDLRTHGSLQIDDAQAWQTAIAAAGHRPALAERMQTHWPMLLGALLIAGASIWAFYRWGTPWAATHLTRWVPLTWEERISSEAMAQLDARYVKPSNLAPERQAELRAEFDKLVAQIGPELRRYPNYQPTMKLHFRSGFGPNAFALPGGTVIMTDAMVEQARLIPNTGDHALLGVLAHEIGHVVHRHGTRMVVEQGVLNVGLGLALGDVSTVVSTGAAVLTGLSYQRGHEVESDCYAIALMKKAGLPVAPMADLLLGLDADMDRQVEREAARSAASAAGKPAPAPKPERASGPRERGADWFSTHPDTAARAERLKSGAPLDCAR